VTSSRAVRVHLLPWTEEPWDLQQTLFSLVAQRGVQLAIYLHSERPGWPTIEATWKRLSPLSGSATLEVVQRARGPWAPAESVAIWVAGTVATPDHLGRCQAALDEGGSIAIAEMRRVGRRAVPGGPPYVLRKTRRAATMDLAGLEEDPAFLGRCLFSARGLPDWIPVAPDEHRRWAQLVWSKARPMRVAEPPLVDLPDLRPSPTLRWGDLRAELDYQVPRWLERRIPFAYTVGHRWRLRLGRLPGKLRALLRR
jgi:hypothetical protein